VNVIGQVATTQAMLPLVRQAAGRIVFIGSVGGILASQFAGAYHASKFAIEAVGDVWRQVLEPEGIDVILTEPSATSTPIWSKAIDSLDELQQSTSPRLAPYRRWLTAFRESLHSADEHGKPRMTSPRSWSRRAPPRSPTSGTSSGPPASWPPRYAPTARPRGRQARRANSQALGVLPEELVRVGPRALRRVAARVRDRAAARVVPRASGRPTVTTKGRLTTTERDGDAEARLTARNRARRRAARSPLR
jgi:hypothetical protein